MNLILIVLACCCAAPQEDQKPTPPAKSLSAPIEAALRGLGPCAESSGDRIENVDKAFDFADRAAKESDNLKSWAMYRVAIEFANAAQEARISHSFAHEMAKRWDVPSDFLPDWYGPAFVAANSPDIRAAELAWLMADDVEHLTAKDSIEKWESCFKQLRSFAGDAGSEHSKRACVKPLSRIKAWLWIAKESAKDNSNAEAFRLILSDKVEAGITGLTKSSNAKISKLATEVTKSETPFSSQHQQLLELLAESKSEAARLSGQRIFASLLPYLTVTQIETCQPICFHMTEPLPLRDDFSLPYHGTLLNGYHGGVKENSIPKGFTFDENEKQWQCKGSSTLEWARLAFENYVQEIELTIDEMDETTKLAFGTEDSVQVRFRKDKDQIETRLIRHYNNRNTWKGTRKVSVGEKLVVRVYRTPERMFASINGNKLTSRFFGLGWHKFRISVGKGSRITVSNIKTRPWLPGDREVVRKLAGEHKSIEMTTLKFRPPSREEYQKYFGSFEGLEFKTEKTKPFATDEEIVMRPVSAARFQLPGDQSRVTISRDFHCSAHEITQKQFAELMEFNPASTQGNPHLPVDNVTLAEAIEFCNRLTAAHTRFDRVPEGYEYRLPTEAEWTLAAMSDGKTDMDVPEAEFWHWKTSVDGFRMVGTSTASERGIFDMHGNVEELTLTQFSKLKATKEKEEFVDPVHLPGSKSHIVIKGGSWNVGPHLATASQRERRHQGRTPGRGFRVVLAPILK